MSTAMNLPSERLGTLTAVLEDLVNEQSQSHLILIHGIADSSNVWREVCEALPTRFKSYQEMSLPWSMEVGDVISYEPSPQEILLAVWKQLPSGPKFVLAHSFGANSLLAMAQTEPLVDVRALVLLSVYSKPSYADFTWDLFVRYVNEFDRFLSLSIDSRPRSKKLSQASKNVILEKAKQMYNPPSWVQFYKLFSTTPGLKLSHLDMPVLFMGGNMDFSIEYSDAYSFSQRFPRSEFHIFEQCGHFAMLEDPALTADVIQRFLKSWRLL